MAPPERTRGGPEAGLRLGVLASGRGTNLQALLDACADGRLPARVVVVIADKPGAAALDRAARAGVPALFADPAAFPDRESYDLHLADLLRRHGVELVVLAGFLRILSPPFVRAFPGRIINVHPSLLPSFRGLGAQRQALEYAVKVSGCTVHFVDEDLDHGPVILQAAVPVAEDDDPEALAARILREEHRLLVEAVRLFAAGRLRLEGRRVHVAGRGRFYLGVDVAEGALTYALVDEELRVEALGTVAGVRHLPGLAGERDFRRPLVIAVDSPARPALPCEPAAVQDLPRSLRGRGRACERALYRDRRFRMAPGGGYRATPVRPEEAPAWMRYGFAVFREIEDRHGYTLVKGRGDLHPGKATAGEGSPAGRRWLAVETFPSAAWRVLAGGRRLAGKRAAEGVVRRLELLAEAGLRATDLEAVPRSPERAADFLDALVSAFVAREAGRGAVAVLPGEGAPEEGVLVLPAAVARGHGVALAVEASPRGPEKREEAW